MNSYNVIEQQIFFGGGQPEEGDGRKMMDEYQFPTVAEAGTSLGTSGSAPLPFPSAKYSHSLPYPAYPDTAEFVQNHVEYPFMYDPSQQQNMMMGGYATQQHQQQSQEGFKSPASTYSFPSWMDSLKSYGTPLLNQHYNSPASSGYASSPMMMSDTSSIYGAGGRDDDSSIMSLPIPSLLNDDSDFTSIQGFYEGNQQAPFAGQALAQTPAFRNVMMNDYHQPGLMSTSTASKQRLLDVLYHNPSLAKKRSRPVARALSSPLAPHHHHHQQQQHQPHHRGARSANITHETESVSADPGGAYTCMHPGCGRSFSRIQNLRSHTRCHLTVAPHQCDTCHMSFKRLTDLQRHVRTVHSNPDQKPWGCHGCGKRFGRSDALKRHVNSRSKKFGCPVLLPHNLTTAGSEGAGSVELLSAGQDISPLPLESMIKMMVADEGEEEGSASAGVPSDPQQTATTNSAMMMDQPHHHSIAIDQLVC